MKYSMEILKFIHENIVVFAYLFAVLSILMFIVVRRATFDNIIDDTMKINGKWSKENLTGFTSFMFSIAYSGFGLIKGKNVQEFVLIAFLSLTAACFGITTWRK